MKRLRALCSRQRKIDIFSHALDERVRMLWRRNLTCEFRFESWKRSISNSVRGACAKRLSFRIRRLTQPPLQPAEKLRQLRTYRLKREPLQGALLGIGDNLSARISIFQQLKRDGSDFVDGASLATCLRERDPFNRAVSAHANGPAEKCVACHLTRHSTAVELQNYLMFGHLSQVIRIWFFLLDCPEFPVWKFYLPEQSSRFVSIQIQDCDRLARLFTKLPRDEQRRKMVARGHVPLACAEKNSRLFVRRYRKVPLSIFQRVWCWNEGDCGGTVFATCALIDLRSFRCRRNAAIGLSHNFHEAR